jgi:excisionase family DNA binding protein
MPTMPTGTITIRDAARRLGVHENTVRRYVDRGLIRARRLPSGVRRLQREDVEVMARQGGEPFGKRNWTLEEIIAQPRKTRPAGAHAAALEKYFTKRDLEEWTRWIHEQHKRDR